MTDKDIEQKAAELAGAEIAFSRSHSAYLQAADRFRRCSQERDRLAAELTTMRAERARVEALDEFASFCEAGM